MILVLKRYTRQICSWSPKGMPPCFCDCWVHLRHLAVYLQTRRCILRDQLRFKRDGGVSWPWGELKNVVTLLTRMHYRVKLYNLKKTVRINKRFILFKWVSFAFQQWPPSPSAVDENHRQNFAFCNLEINLIAKLIAIYIQWVLWGYYW